MRIRLRLYIYLIIFVGVALFFNSLTSSFIGDDFDQIVDNTSILHPANVLKFFTGSTFYSGGGENAGGLHYRPLMLFFYSMIYSIFGLKPIFFHILQLLLHLSNTIMLFLFLRYFFKTPLSFFLSLLFLVHPINSETVVYIANLQDTLFLFFGMLTILLLQAGKIKNNITSILLTVFLLTLSLFSKETGILFSLIFILHSLIFKKIPFIFTLISSLTSVFIYLITRFIVAGLTIPDKAIAPISNASLLERLLSIPAIIFYYIKTLLFPVNITTSQFWFYKDINFHTFYLPLSIVLLTLLLIYLIGKKLISKKASKNIFYFFLFWLVLGVSLHLHIIPLEMTVADRWFYFPFIGVLGLVGLTIENMQFIQRHSKPLLTLSIVILLTLSYITFNRNLNWKDPITLYEHDTKIDKNNFFLENSLGTEYLMKGEYDLAKPHIEKSVALYPYFGNLNNMAVISSKEGNKKKTKEYLERAIRIDNNYIVTENYAKFLYTTESPQTTKKYIISSLRRYPNNATLWMYLGLTENKLGNHKKAVEFTKKAYDLNPNDLTKSTYMGLKGVKLIEQQNP